MEAGSPHHLLHVHARALAGNPKRPGFLPHFKTRVIMFQDLPRISVEALDMGDIAFWEPPHLHQELDARSPSLLSLRDKTEIAKQSDCQIMASTQVKSRNLRPTESPRTSAFMTISRFSCSQKFGYWLDHLQWVSQMRWRATSSSWYLSSMVLVTPERPRFGVQAAVKPGMRDAA